jgi:hypothetical protein
MEYIWLVESPGIKRAGDADPGSLFKGGEEKRLHPKFITKSDIVLDAWPMPALCLPHISGRDGHIPSIMGQISDYLYNLFRNISGWFGKLLKNWITAWNCFNWLVKGKKQIC